jgi:hypothetical protein
MESREITSLRVKGEEVASNYFGAKIVISGAGKAAPKGAKTHRSARYVRAGAKNVLEFASIAMRLLGAATL